MFRLILLFITITISWGANATPPLPLSLKDAIQMAKEKSVNVIVANERVQQALARLSQTRSVLLPQIDGVVLEQRKTVNLNAQGITIPGQSGVVGPFDAFDARAKLTQTIFDLSAIERLRQSKAGQGISEAEATKAKQDAMALVATLYIEAKRAHDGIQMATTLLRRDEENFKLTTTQFKLGTGSDVAVKQAEAFLAESRHRLEKAKATALERRLDFSASLSIPSDQPILFSEGNLPTLKTFPSENEIAETTATHPDVALAQENLKQRNIDKTVEVAWFVPKITGNADYGNIGRHVLHTDGTYTLGVQLSIPIFDSGLKSGKYREASSRFRESEATLNDVKQHVTANALSAKETVKQTEALVAASKTKKGVAVKERMLVQQRVETGIGSRLELVVATANEAIATDGEYEALATHHIAQINLAHAMGNMEALCR